MNNRFAIELLMGFGDFNYSDYADQDNQDMISDIHSNIIYDVPTQPSEIIQGSYIDGLMKIHYHGRKLKDFHNDIMQGNCKLHYNNGSYYLVIL